MLKYAKENYVANLDFMSKKEGLVITYNTFSETSTF